MIARWEQGRSTIDLMLARGELERVHADRNLAELYLAHAERHLATASLAIDDVAGSFQLTYDAGRKALSAVLENQGLRATTRGGHRAIEDAVRAQLVPPFSTVVSGFGWMRQLRNASEYLPIDRATASSPSRLPGNPASIGRVHSGKNRPGRDRVVARAMGAAPPERGGR